MFAKEGLLDPLASALLSMAGDDDDLAASALQKVVQIFLLFSQSDLKVKMELAQRATVLRESKRGSRKTQTNMTNRCAQDSSGCSSCCRSNCWRRF